MTGFEEEMFYRANNAFRDPNETISWALTNRGTQEWLESVPYKQSSSLWQELVRAVRSFLGLTPKADTALSEVLQAAQELIEAPIFELEQTAANVETSFHIQEPAG